MCSLGVVRCRQSSGFQCSMSSGEEYRPAHGELAQAECETSSSMASEEEQQEQPVQVQAGRPPAPQWNEELALDNNALIQLVQERILLWDSRDPLHSDKLVTWRLWNEMAAALMDDCDNASPRVRKDFLNKVRTRWRSVMDRFNRDVWQESRVPLGSAARTSRKYRYHQALAFLRPVLATSIL
ncbi:uncharacterized protein [Dendrobates tinctorius]|uniref:uncharacterized protein isoform X2 n=1 Tax=Dendrobates tinctorius TaxID=92724 RepID=UPI003CC9FD85